MLYLKASKSFYAYNCIFYRNKDVIPGMSATQDGIQRASANNVLLFGYNILIV